ncbi:MAG: membrane protein insertase YidC [Elusimicrobiota bacterium]|jgi:YidC/Oxa1 family membrane protein insertase|nr:membrane protein insertase YidC [Elusimicrobiota bacterium]
MNKNTLLFIVLSLAVIVVWNFSLNPTPPQNQDKAKQESAAAAENTSAQGQQETSASQNNAPAQNLKTQAPQSQLPVFAEELVEINTDKYKALLTNKGAAVNSWIIKDGKGKEIDLIVSKNSPAISNFPSVNYKVISKEPQKAVFEFISPDGWKITKTYSFSKDSYMHNLSIKVERLKAGAVLPKIDIVWGPGIATDERNSDENLSLTRVGAFTAGKGGKYKVLKNESEGAASFSWAAIDNRYFLAAFIPKDINDFSQIKSYREDKKHYYLMTIEGIQPQENKEIVLDFYVGPKGYTYLQTYNIKLEETVDFGFFGILGRTAFKVLSFFHSATNNYGWAIIILTIIIQILILPLTLKSYKSMAAMKRIQPMIKTIQDRYKNDKQRLQVEMMNVYKSQKVNPLGGCLPMLCQLPIFWAFFTMLRNAFELRGAQWILWVNDLSAADSFLTISGFTIHLLPLIMGAGMFFQQKMTSAASDPTQRKMMYILPIVFTFMFWSFPAGLVLYWLTNSIVSMIEQYIVLRRDAVRVTTIKR